MIQTRVVFAILGLSTVCYVAVADPPLKGNGLQSLSRFDATDQPEPAPIPKKKSPTATGSMRVDRITLKPGKSTVKVDAAKHCVYVLNKHATEKDGAVRVELERGTTYTITAAGEAFQSAHVGRDADPFPGVVLFYGTDEEDGYATRYTVLKPNKEISFTTPWNISPTGEVFVMAFFLDHWPESPNRGCYTLTIARKDQVRGFRASDSKPTPDEISN